MLNVKLKKTEDLLKVLSAAENILSINTGENKLKFIKFANVDNKLHISGRNPYMRFEYITNCIEEISGECGLYECKTLLSLINVINESIEINDGSIKSKKVQYKIPCVDGSDYPNDEFPSVENWIEADSKSLINAIANVVPAVDKITESAMSGIYIGEDKLLACDSKRIFMQDVKTNEQIRDNILPKELIKYILKLPLEEKIHIGTTNGNILIKDNNLKLSCAKLSSKYPKVEAILPKTIKNRLTINRDEFCNALNMVAPIIDEATKKCTLEYNSQDMIIKVDNGVDTAETRIVIDSLEELNDRVKVEFNIQLLMDMLKANQETIEIKIYEDSIGYMFSSNGSKQFIMPLVN